MAEDGCDHEQDVEDGLHPLQPVVRIVEREPNEQVRRSAQSKLGHDAGWIAPIFLELLHATGLEMQWRTHSARTDHRQ